jgi:hypothetical protein
MEHYVYIHAKRDTGEIFYVGKGIKKRAWVSEGRHPHWINTVKKHGYTAHILESFDNEQDAFGMERYLIASYRTLGAKLVNKTDGGEGVSGRVWKPTQEQIERNRKSGKLRMQTSEGKSTLRKMWDAAHTLEARKKTSASLKEYFSDPLERARRALANGGIPFRCLTNGVAYLTQAEAADAIGVGAGNLCNVLRGERPHTKGYTFSHLTRLECLTIWPDYPPELFNHVPD